MRVSVSHLQTLLTLEASTAKQEDSGDRLPSFPPSTTYFLHRSQLYMLSPAQGSKGQRSARDGDKRANMNYVPGEENWQDVTGFLK